MGCNRAGPQHGAGDREVGWCGEVIKSFPDEVTHAAGRGIGREDDIGVGEEQDWVAEGEERPQGRFHGALLVVGGHHDGEAGEWGIVWTWRCHLFQPGDFVVAAYGGDGDRHPCSEGEGREGDREGHVGGMLGWVGGDARGVRCVPTGEAGCPPGAAAGW